MRSTACVNIFKCMFSTVHLTNGHENLKSQSLASLNYSDLKNIEFIVELNKSINRGIYYEVRFELKDFQYRGQQKLGWYYKSSSEKYLSSW